MELRHNREMDNSLPAKTHKVTFVLPLRDDEEDLWKSFISKLRSQIKRPMKEDMYAASGGLDLFGRFLSCVLPKYAGFRNTSVHESLL